MKGTARNYGKVKESGMFELLPENDYAVEIARARATDNNGELQVTKNGDPMVSVMLEVIEGEYKGRTVWTNIIIFNISDPNDPPKGAGIAKHFLHVIGEPYEGDFVWDSDNWIGKQLKVTVKEGEYKGKPKNEVSNFDWINGRPEDTTDDPFAGDNDPLSGIGK